MTRRTRERTMRVVKGLARKGDATVSISMAWMMKDRAEIRRRVQNPPFLLDIFEVILAMFYAILTILALFQSKHEVPHMPLRLWIVFYMLQCFFQPAFFLLQYPSNFQQGIRPAGLFLRINHNMKLVKNGKDVLNVVMWTVGMMLVVKGSGASYETAPMLTRAVIFFTIFDFVIFIALTLLVSAAALVVCCCIPFIYFIFYFLGDQFFQGGERQLPPCPFCQQSVGVEGA